MDPGFAGPKPNPNDDFDSGFNGPQTPGFDDGFNGPRPNPNDDFDSGFNGPQTPGFDDGFNGPRPDPNDDFDLGFNGPQVDDFDFGFNGPQVQSIADNKPERPHVFKDVNLDITSFNLYGKDSGGKLEVLNPGQIDLSEKMASGSYELNLEFNWSTEDSIEFGDVATINLPKGLDYSYFIQDDYELKDGEGNVIGKFEIFDGYVEIVFNDELEGLEDKHGDLWLSYNLTKEDLISGNIVVDYDSEQWDFSYSKEEIFMKKDGKQNGSNIDWTIRIDDNLEIDELTLRDSIPKGLELVGKIQVVDKSGDKIGEYDSFPINLEDTDVKNIVVKYTTKIVSKETSYYNKATITDDNKSDQEVASSDKTVVVNWDNVFKKQPGKIEDVKDNPLKKVIKWKIEVNKSKVELFNAVVKDDIMPGHKLVGDIKANGEVLGSDKVQINGNKDGFTANLGDINDTVILEYTTEFNVKDTPVGQSKEYKNKASLESDNFMKLDSEASTYYFRNKMLQKWGSAPELTRTYKRIAWNVQVNIDGTLKDPVIKDKLGRGMEFDVDSLEINGIYGKLEKGKDYDVVLDKDTNELTINFKGEFQSLITIRYYANILDHNLDYYQNKAILEVDGEELDNFDTGVPGTTLKNTLKKYMEGYDYKNRTIDWKVVLKSNKGKFKSIKLDDLMSENLTLVKGSVRLDLDGQTLKLIEDYTIEEGKSGFNIYITEAGLSKQKEKEPQLTVRYRSMGIKGAPGNTVKNTAKATINTEYGKPGEILQDILEEPIITWIAKNGSKKGNLDIDNRRISWRINAEPLMDSQNVKENVRFVDTIEKDNPTDPERSQEIDKDTFRVESYEIDKNGSPSGAITTLIEDSEYTVDYFTEQGVDGKDYIYGFELVIKQVNTPILINYDTKLKGESKPIYKNSITEDGTEIPSEDVKHNDYDKFISKTGVTSKGQNVTSNGQVVAGSVVNWSVDINESRSEFRNTIIEDTISSNQKLIPNSITLKNAATGKVVDLTNRVSINGKKVVDFNDDYEISEDGVTTLELDLGYMNKHYILEYDTKVRFITIEEQGEDISNSIKLTSSTIDVKEDAVSDVKIIFKAGGTGTGVPGKASITLEKVDGSGNLITTDSAKFELYHILDDGTEELIGEFETVNGEVIMPKLAYGKYRLVETKAPEGYAKSNLDEVITLDGKFNKDIDLEFTNIKQEGKIVLEKVDANDPSLKLEGAVFEILDHKDNLVGRVTTDENGYAEVGLEFGDYKVVEVEAPEGYVIYNGLKYVSVTQDTKEIKLIVENKKQDMSPTFGNIRILKVDGETKKPLEGAKFEIIGRVVEQDENGLTRNIKFEKIDEVISGKDGYATIKVPYGEYIIREIEAPEGYIVSEQYKNVSIAGQKFNPVIGIENFKNIPEKPEKPLIPLEPSKPIKPTDPKDPKDPEDPTEPWEPTRPTDPRDPWEPTRPTDPIDPTEPWEPTRPTDPTDPKKPRDPKGTALKGDLVSKDLPENEKTGGKTPKGQGLDGSIKEKTPNQSRTDKNGNVLPKTGESPITSIVFAVIGLSVVGLGLFLRKKKEQ